MVFEIGKYYHHPGSGDIAILCEVETTLRGKGFIAECSGKMTPCGFKENPNSSYKNLIPSYFFHDELALVGKDEEAAVNWYEISKDEWMENFSKNRKYKR